MIRVCVRVKKLQDGRFLVQYFWDHWYTIACCVHREYFESKEKKLQSLSADWWPIQIGCKVVVRT